MSEIPNFTAKRCQMIHLLHAFVRIVYTCSLIKATPDGYFGYAMHIRPSLCAKNGFKSPTTKLKKLKETSTPCALQVSKLIVTNVGISHSEYESSN